MSFEIDISKLDPRTLMLSKTINDYIDDPISFIYQELADVVSRGKSNSILFFDLRFFTPRRVSQLALYFQGQGFGVSHVEDFPIKIEEMLGTEDRLPNEYLYFKIWLLF